MLGQLQGERGAVPPLAGHVLPGGGGEGGAPGGRRALSCGKVCSGAVIRGPAPTFRALLVGDPVVGEGQSALPVHRRPIRGEYPDHVSRDQLPANHGSPVVHAVPPRVRCPVPQPVRVEPEAGPILRHARGRDLVQHL